MLALVNDEPWPSFAVGDVPTQPLALTLDTEDTWTGVEVSAGTATLTGTSIELTLPPLSVPGVLTITLVVTGADGSRATIEPVRIVVEDPEAQWLSLSGARADWPDAPESDLALYRTLVSARIACEDFAPEADPIPDSYLVAQLTQAKAVWGSLRATNDSRIGEGEFAVTVYPLDWSVKQLLRPKSGVPVMF